MVVSSLEVYPDYSYLLEESLHDTINDDKQGEGRARNSDGFVCLDSTQEIYIPSDSQETSLQTYTHVFSLKCKIADILTDLNWKSK